MKIIKKIIPIILLILAITLMGSSCNSDKEEDNPPYEPEFYMKAKVDGQDFSGLEGNATVTTTGTIVMETIIIGMDSTGNKIKIVLNDYNDETGNFNFISNNASQDYMQYETSQGEVWIKQAMTIHNGTLTIEENTTTYIKGTFSFKGVKGFFNTATFKDITEGSFKVKKVI